MIISEDGTVTGSVDVSKLNDIDAKTDEAKVQIESLKADVQAGQEQTARDAERVAEQSRVQAAQLGGDGGGKDTSATGETTDAATAKQEQEAKATADAKAAEPAKTQEPSRRSSTKG